MTVKIGRLRALHFFSAIGVLSGIAVTAVMLGVLFAGDPLFETGWITQSLLLGAGVSLLVGSAAVSEAAARKIRNWEEAERWRGYELEILTVKECKAEAKVVPYLPQPPKYLPEASFNPAPLYDPLGIAGNEFRNRMIQEARTYESAMRDWSISMEMALRYPRLVHAGYRNKVIFAEYPEEEVMLESSEPIVREQRLAFRIKKDPESGKPSKMVYVKAR